MLIAQGGDSVVTVGSDLKIRRHQHTVGLPVMDVTSPPGSSPSGLVFHKGAFWSSDASSGYLYKHARDLQVLQKVPSAIRPPESIASDGEALWVIGGSPLKAARLRPIGKGHRWEGPYDIPNLLPVGVQPSGATIGFGRLWVIAGGDPRMVSTPLATWRRTPVLWPSSKTTKKEEPEKAKKDAFKDAPKDRKK
jgi:hypothetical protein